MIFPDTPEWRNMLAGITRCEHGIQTELQMCWQCKDKQDRAAKEAQLTALKSENTALTAARDLALAALNKQDAEIAALKAERDALRKDADLWRYALKRGIVTVHSERIVDHDSGTRCSWIQGHYKSADIPNAAVIKETKNG